jgi:EAL domain-containing protein (putative c-di-GMP-specific phosphodiesterase class I)
VVRFAERIQSAIAVPLLLSGHEVYLTVSIGIALSQTGYESGFDVLRDADTAMYRAKALGKARHEMFDEAMHERARRTLEIEAELRQAIDREQFVLRYQPIVTVDHQKAVGFEALVRWEHPERGLIPPNDFIPLAEETGVIVPLGMWVLRSACAQLRQWHDDGWTDLRIAVNCSAHQVEKSGFETLVGEILDEYGLDGRYLELEITEGVLLRNADATLETLRKLRARGVRIAIDDFGTGYSALGYIKSLPITTLKVDRSFTRDVDSDTRTAAIVGAIVTIAHSLGLTVVAEGVETEGQRLFMNAQHCDEYQGYLTSPPVPPVEAIAFACRPA